MVLKTAKVKRWGSADAAAKDCQFTREAQDASRSKHCGAQSATAEGRSSVRSRRSNQDRQSRNDELPRKARPDKIPSPACVHPTAPSPPPTPQPFPMAPPRWCRCAGRCRSRARNSATIVAQASHAQSRRSLPLRRCRRSKRPHAPAGNQRCRSLGDQRFFAVVPMIAMKELGLSHDIINVNGGVCALVMIAPAAAHPVSLLAAL